MKFRLLRRRLSVSAPRMIVRSHLPWPLRWAVVAFALGFCAALALWAFEFGKEIAGLDRGARQELAELRAQVLSTAAERERAVSVANAAESMLRAERATQERLAAQLKQLESENLSLKADLGFFEKLLPTGDDDLAIRGLQVEPRMPGELRLQVLVMRPGRNTGEFSGRVQVTLSGTLEGRAWSLEPAENQKSLKMKQLVRLDERVLFPAAAVVKVVRVRILDERGAVRSTQSTEI
jgi:hypothetical protein